MGETRLACRPKATGSNKSGAAPQAPPARPHPLHERQDMTDPTCTIPECNRPHNGSPYCRLHYSRWIRNGDPLNPSTIRTQPALKISGGEEKLKKVWRQMKSRCEKPTDHRYYRYGARGITVCEEWQQYIPFRTWALANGYQDGLTIERTDNNGPYHPGNCTWIPAAEQARNRSSRASYTAFGETKSLSEWTQDPRCVVTAAAFTLRVQRRKWDVERALTTPLIHNNDAATECPQGHPYTEDNIVWDGPYGTWRKCKECNRVRARANYHRKRT
jgi:hypothetical protein